MNEKTKGASSLLAGAFVVSTFGIWTRFVSPMLSSAAQTTMRCLLAAGVMAIVVFVGRKKYTLRGYTKHQYALIGVLGALTVALGLLFVVSVTATKVGNTFSLIYAGSIITTFVIGTFFLGEKVSPLKIAAVAMALVGLGMYTPELLSLSLGIVAGLGAGICDGLSNITRKQLRGVDRNVAVMYQYLMAGVLAAPFVLILGGDPVKAVSAGPIIALVVYSIVSIVFAKLLLYGFSRFDVNVGGVILAMQIFFGMLLGFLFFHEVPSGNELAGSVLIFVAVLLAVNSSIRASKAAAVGAEGQAG